MSEDPIKTLREQLAVTDPGSDVDKLIATSERMLAAQREKMFAERGQYGAARQAIIDRGWVSAQRLRVELDENLKALDEDHDRRMKAFDSIIRKLTALRG